MSRKSDEPNAREGTPPRTGAEALERARDHARVAAAEAIKALHAVLDAAALAGAGSPAEAHRLLGPAARLLTQLARDLGSGRDSAAESLLESVARAVDEEVARWEQRAQDDADARAVLRTFLGLRELLWEVGGRPSAGDAQSGPARRRPKPGGPRRRVQRVTVEG